MFCGDLVLRFPEPPPPKKRAQVISPTACGALFSARTTPQPSQNLEEPWWSPGGTLPQGRPGPPRSLSGLRPPNLSAVGETLISLPPTQKKEGCNICKLPGSANFVA